MPAARTASPPPRALRARHAAAAPANGEATPAGSAQQDELGVEGVATMATAGVLCRPSLGAADCQADSFVELQSGVFECGTVEP